MGNDELTKLKENLGCIISANGFLSTSCSKDVAMEFATKPTKRTNIVSVLQEIECSSDILESIVFANITKYSEFEQEQEVLFDLSSTFKIESISENDPQLVVVKLTATDAGTKIAEKYVDLNRKRNEETTPDILFGILLVQMGKYDQSLTYFKNLLNASDDKVDEARIYNTIGSAYLCKPKLNRAYKFAKRAYRMMIFVVKGSRIKDSTRPMTIMAHVYLRKEMYEESLDFYLEVLEISEKFYGRKHLDTAVALDHIGNAYLEIRDYEQALVYYGKSFKIRQEQLPPVHLDIAASLNNLGLVRWGLKSIDKALEHFQESLKIRKQLLPSDHISIIQSLDNIATLLYKQHRIDDALQYFTDALSIQKISFDSTDRDDLLRRLEGKAKIIRFACDIPMVLIQEKLITYKSDYEHTQRDYYDNTLLYYRKGSTRYVTLNLT
ncbi:unnamed protein product [Adineta steineri]|uniref:ADP ribosyltransferase domain-containing protein n=1 Tax=Adineta steineri TaxID=433720 RepID=A0A819W021_9BILA|nr:unnamed protein product [Adineta steineri]CAF4116461.1 unnamed protein product [Adineta steineri]